MPRFYKSSGRYRYYTVPLVLGFAVLAATELHAFGCRPGLIPNGIINSCGNCHQGGISGAPRNAFGLDVDEVAMGCNPFWGPALAMEDSDGDGRTNGEELQDPLGAWQPGDPQPGDCSLVTNPGLSDTPPPNNPPLAFISGPATVNLELTGVDVRIRLDGSDSNDGNFKCQGITFLWERLSGPESASIVSPTDSATDVVLTETGTYEFQLTVDDGQGANNTATDTVTVIVTGPPPNNPPTAVISTTPRPPLVFLVEGMAAATLDGSGSDDGDGGSQGLSYEWEKVDGPPDADTIVDPGATVTEVTFTDFGVFRYRLRVDDGQSENNQDSAEVEVVVAKDLPSEFIRGDANSSGVLDLSDAIFTFDFLFVGGPTPDCDDSADANDDGLTDISDGIYSLVHLFLGDPPPPAPFPDCGEDPTGDPLECGFFPPCP